MHKSQRQISDFLKPGLKARGFQKHRLTWHKRMAETILVFQVEKNRWGGNKYDVHLGIYPDPPEETFRPAYHECPIQAELVRLVPDRFEFRRILDFDDTSFTLEERLAQIEQMVSQHGLPWLNRYSALSELYRLAQLEYEELYPPVFMWRTTYDHLRDKSGSPDDRASA